MITIGRLYGENDEGKIYKPVKTYESEVDALEEFMALSEEWLLDEWNYAVNSIGNLRIFGKDYTIEKAIEKRWNFFKSTYLDTTANDEYAVI